MESFNPDFCEKLNIYLTQVMRHSADHIAHGCSMDGVLMPFIEQQSSKKHINDIRRLDTSAWVLIHQGSIKFNVTVYFGKYSLRRYAKGAPMDDCLQAVDNPDAVRIDLEERMIEIRLS